MSYDDTNKGALFRNNRKETDNHPDYRGNLNVSGRDFWLSAWLKTSKKGEKYMSLSLQPKGAPRDDTMPGNDDLDEQTADIPF